MSCPALRGPLNYQRHSPGPHYADPCNSRTARTAKRARLTSKDQVDLKNEQKPKWSNPDPYYNNPPTFDASKKKTDVVKLIRKRRAEEAPVKPKTSSAEDFIAFNFSDDDSEESVVEVVEPLSTTAGTSRRTLNTFSHLDNLHPDRMKKKSDVLKTEVIEILDDGDDPDPPRGTSINVWPPPLPAPVVSESKGKRKREEDDRPAQVTAVSTSWRAKAGHIAVPWWQPRPGLTVEQSLHQEILDFYSFVQPRDFERQQRHLLIHNLQGFLNQTYHYEQASVMYFGSYGAGLYLPDGDMDLVIRSQRFSKGGDPSIGQGRRPMNRFADDLVRQGIARRGSVIVIHKSKVPIIKYIDNLTGLHVDISFENDTGPIANGTYTMWTTQYPALPMMVSLVKQFLHMRSLNDVANGGIGGFTITCLVVSMLQLNPQLSSANLGTMFLHFLDLYGNKFDTTTYGICLNPPGHFRKAGTHLRLNPSRPWALSIQDPNKPDNDISGGSHNVRFILKTFSEAHRALTQVMDQARKSRTSGDCLLHCILAGDYSSYTRQRNRLRDLANRP